MLVPTEIAVYIASLLDAPALVKLSQTSSYWRNISNRSEIWKNLCASLDPKATHLKELCPNDHSTWKDYYKKIYCTVIIPHIR